MQLQVFRGRSLAANRSCILTLTIIAIPRPSMKTSGGDADKRTAAAAKNVSLTAADGVTFKAMSGIGLYQIPFYLYREKYLLSHCGHFLQPAEPLQPLLRSSAQQSRSCNGQPLHVVGFDHAKDEARRGQYSVCKFVFLGDEFRPRWVRNSQRGTIFARFTPAVSPKACKAMRQTIRSWRRHLKTTLSLDEVAQQICPTLRGWVNYYGHFNRGWLIKALRTVDQYLVRWAMRKYKRLREGDAKGWQ